MTFFLLITYVKNTILITSAFICLHSCPPSGTSLSFHLQRQHIILSYHQMKLILSSTCMENNCFGQFDSVRCFPSIVLKKKRFSESLRPTHINFCESRTLPTRRWQCWRMTEQRSWFFDSFSFPPDLLALTFQTFQFWFSKRFSSGFSQTF